MRQLYIVDPFEYVILFFGWIFFIQVCNLFFPAEIYDSGSHMFVGKELF